MQRTPHSDPFAVLWGVSLRSLGMRCTSSNAQLVAAIAVHLCGAYGLWFSSLSSRVSRSSATMWK